MSEFEIIRSVIPKEVVQGFADLVAEDPFLPRQLAAVAELNAYVPGEYKYDFVHREGGLKSDHPQLVDNGPQEGGMDLPFHQDADYHPGVVIGFALTANTAENGAPRFLKHGSEAEKLANETAELLRHDSVCSTCGVATPNHTYECDQHVTAELEPGDMLIFDTQEWHGGGANLSDSNRVIVYFRYILPGPNELAERTVQRRHERLNALLQEEA